MSTRLRITALLASGLCLLLLGFAGGVFWAAQRVPDFYEAALETEPERVRKASDEMLAGATALASNVRKQGQWQALFTAEQINGWLAVDLPENYPELLPEDISDPRVRLRPEGATLAVRYGDSVVPTVISIELDMYVTEADTIALHIRSVKAGAIPVPMTTVLDIVSSAAEDLDLTIHWRDGGGEPVALVSIPPARDGDTVYQLEALELGEDQVYLAGKTESATVSHKSAHQPRPNTLAYFLSRLKFQH